jgi:hypothetical protein
VCGHAVQVHHCATGSGVVLNPSIPSLSAACQASAGERPGRAYENVATPASETSYVLFVQRVLLASGQKRKSFAPIVGVTCKD